MALKTVKTLAKLQKQQVDRLRRQIAAMEMEKAQLEQARAALARELQDEIKLAQGSPEFGSFFGDFAKRVRMRDEQLIADVKRVDQAIEAVRFKMRETFAEQKKYDLLRDRKIEEEKIAAAKKESAQLDEVGSTRRRKAQQEEA